jgi:hypothetical protein
MAHLSTVNPDGTPRARPHAELPADRQGVAGKPATDQESRPYLPAEMEGGAGAGARLKDHLRLRDPFDGARPAALTTARGSRG